MRRAYRRDYEEIEEGQKEEMNLPYRIHKASTGWLVQRKVRFLSDGTFVYETLAYCKTLQEATNYLFAWKEINA